MNGLESFLNALAVVGAMLLVFGFYRVNIGKWNNKSFWYELDNLIGATLLVIYQLYYHAYVTVIVNTIWGAIALWGLFVFVRRARAHRRRAKK